MEQRLRESLSALMDDEANELEVERVLSRAADDGDVRGTWVRYHAVRAVVRKEDSPYGGFDVSSRVRAALAEGTAPRAQTLRDRLSGFTQPLAGFAVAASVAAVVVVGGMQLNDVESPVVEQPAIAVSPPGMVGGPFGATAVPASYGATQASGLQPTPATGYRELARQRMQRYMQSHAEAAALNSPQGLVPYARVREIQE